MSPNVKVRITSFARDFLLLVIVAGALISGSGAVSGYNDHGVLHRIELVFNSESFSQTSVLSVCEVIQDGDMVEGRILRSHPYGLSFGNELFVAQNTGRVNIRPFYTSFNHTGSFNIPHQNSDENEASILLANVASPSSIIGFGRNLQRCITRGHIGVRADKDVLSQLTVK